MDGVEGYRQDPGRRISRRQRYIMRDSAAGKPSPLAVRPVTSAIPPVLTSPGLDKGVIRPHFTPGATDMPAVVGRVYDAWGNKGGVYSSPLISASEKRGDGYFPSSGVTHSTHLSNSCLPPSSLGTSPAGLPSGASRNHPLSSPSHPSALLRSPLAEALSSSMSATTVPSKSIGHYPQTILEPVITHTEMLHERGLACTSYSAPPQRGIVYSAPLQAGAGYSAPLQGGTSYSAPLQGGASYSAPLQAGSAAATSLRSSEYVMSTQPYRTEASTTYRQTDLPIISMSPTTPQPVRTTANVQTRMTHSMPTDHQWVHLPSPPHLADSQTLKPLPSASPVTKTDYYPVPAAGNIPHEPQICRLPVTSVDSVPVSSPPWRDLGREDQRKLPAAADLNKQINQTVDALRSLMSLLDSHTTECLPTDGEPLLLRAEKLRETTGLLLSEDRRLEGLRGATKDLSRLLADAEETVQKAVVRRREESYRLWDELQAQRCLLEQLRIREKSIVESVALGASFCPPKTALALLAIKIRHLEEEIELLDSETHGTRTPSRMDKTEPVETYPRKNSVEMGVEEVDRLEADLKESTETLRSLASRRQRLAATLLEKLRLRRLGMEFRATESAALALVAGRQALYREILGFEKPAAVDGSPHTPLPVSTGADAGAPLSAALLQEFIGRQSGGKRRWAALDSLLLREEHILYPRRAHDARRSPTLLTTECPHVAADDFWEEEDEEGDAEEGLRTLQRFERRLVEMEDLARQQDDPPLALVIDRVAGQARIHLVAQMDRYDRLVFLLRVVVEFVKRWQRLPVALEGKLRALVKSFPGSPLFEVDPLVAHAPPGLLVHVSDKNVEQPAAQQSPALEPADMADETDAGDDRQAPGESAPPWSSQLTAALDGVISILEEVTTGLEIPVMRILSPASTRASPVPPTEQPPAETELFENVKELPTKKEGEAESFASIVGNTVFPTAVQDVAWKDIGDEYPKGYSGESFADSSDEEPPEKPSEVGDVVEITTGQTHGDLPPVFPEDNREGSAGGASTQDVFNRSRRAFSITSQYTDVVKEQSGVQVDVLERNEEADIAAERADADFEDKSNQITLVDEQHGDQDAVMEQSKEQVDLITEQSKGQADIIIESPRAYVAFESEQPISRSDLGGERQSERSSRSTSFGEQVSLDDKRSLAREERDITNKQENMPNAEPDETDSPGGNEPSPANIDADPSNEQAGQLVGEPDVQAEERI